VLSVNPSLTLTNYTLTKPAPKNTVTFLKAIPTKAQDTAYPTFPDVSLKKLPFFKTEDTLLKPSTLQPMGRGKTQQQNFSFYLTPGQINRISNSRYKTGQGKMEYRQQIQMRFSLLETTCDQLDNFPSSVSVKVNGKMCSLPNIILNKTVRPSLPVNITSLCKLSPTTSNTITVSWAVEVGKAHTISVYQVENLTHKDLLDQLKMKGQRQPDYTKALIKEKLSDQDQEIATTSCKVTLACPLGKMRMTAPARASTCDHLQCFDAQLYLMMNEKKPKWVCPVCNKPALMENLLIDGFFLDLVRSPRLPSDEHEIVLHNDGTWDPITAKKGETKSDDKPAKPVVKKTIYFGQAASKRPLDDGVDCITLDDSVGEAPAKRMKLTTSSDIECIDID